MYFWTSPQPISQFDPFDFAVVRYMGDVLQVGDMHSFDHNIISGSLSICQDAVRFDFGVHNAFVVQRSGSVQSVSQDSFRHGQRHIRLKEKHTRRSTRIYSNVNMECSIMLSTATRRGGELRRFSYMSRQYWKWADVTILEDVLQPL
jgi:hypothetical protein